MHARELIELAALVSHYREEMVTKSEADAPQGLVDYWLHSKSRHIEWMRGLAAFEHRWTPVAGRSGQECAWLDWQPLFQEILLSEIPVRVMAVVAQTVDDRCGVREWLPLASSVFESQLDASRRLLRRMVDNSYTPALESTLRLNQLRRRVEHWTDFLLAPWHAMTRVEKFAFDMDRVDDFAQSINSGVTIGTLTYWDLTLASLRGAFRHDVVQQPFLPRWNYLLATSIFGCIPATIWLAPDDVSRAWTARMMRSAEQTEALVAGALRNEFCG